MKVAFVCNEYPPYPPVGGIGVFTQTAAHGLVAAGHQVTVVGFGKNAGQRDDGGVQVVTLPEVSRQGIAWYVNRRRLYSWLKQNALAGRVDLVEVPDYCGLLPFAFSYCPVLVRLHASGMRQQRIIRILERRTLKHHRQWIGVSAWIGQDTQRKYKLRPSRFSVVYNPVSLPEERAKVPFSLPEQFVLYAGTVRSKKGPFVLAEAARTFLAALPDLHLVYVGGLTTEDGIRADQRIRQLVGAALADRVHCMGVVEHDVVLSCMRRARVFAFPSKLEAFSLVPVEAMACGAPVVYTTECSGPEAVEHGVTGLLANPYSADDVAEKIMQILRDEGLAARLSENARTAVKERFSLDRCIRETLAFYQLCSGRG